VVVRTVILALAFFACSTSEDPAVDSVDAGLAPAIDAAVDAASGFGSVTGACGELDDELVSAAPDLFRLSIEFDRLFSDTDKGLLSAGAQVILQDGNAGGSSVLSEVFAFDVLERCEGASLLKTETQIDYDTEGKLTDFLADIDTEKIGVSVTRAVTFPFDSVYPLSAAEDLLTSKLGDILVSTANVSANDRWQKQVLAILAYGPEHADTVELAYAALGASLKADTLVYLVVTEGTDDFIYCDGPCE
jgi:hypothetical protein